MKFYVLVVLLAFVCYVQSVSVHKREAVDLKTRLIAKAQELLNRAVIDIETYGTGNEQSVVTINAELKQIKYLISNLTATTNDTQIRAFEESLSYHIIALTQYLRLLEGEAHKTYLLNRALSELNSADQNIESAGTEHIQFVEAVKRSVVEIKTLVIELIAATDVAHVRQLEQRLSEVEEDLSHRMRNFEDFGE